MALRIGDAHREIVDRLEATVSGFVEAPYPLSPRRMPAQIADRSFSVELRTENARLTRDKDGDAMSFDHVVLLTFARKILPKAQQSTYTSALGDEDAVVVSLMDQANAWQREMRLLFVRSTRELNDSGEWLFVQMEFEARHLMAL